MANPRCYAVNVAFAVTSPTDTAIITSSTTAIRPEWYDMVLGFSSTPADNGLTVQVQRYTAAGTTTSQTPRALDPGDPACTAVAGNTATIEPTYTASAILFHLGINQRASHRWVADPQGRLKMPATASNGLGLFAVHSSATPTFDAVVHFNE